MEPYTNTRRLRTKKRSKDGKTTHLYALNKPNMKAQNSRTADELRAIADELQRGDFGKIDRIAVVMDQGRNDHNVAFVDVEGRTRDTRWWTGLFMEVIDNLLRRDG